MMERLDVQRLLHQIGEVQSTTLSVKDLEHRYVLVNRRFADSVGLPAKAVIGRDDLEIGIPERMVLGDPQTGYPGSRALEERALASGRTHRCEETGDGHLCGDVERADTVRMPLFDRDGATIGLLVQSRDASDVATLRQRLDDETGTVAALDGELNALEDVLSTLTARRALAPLLDEIAEIVVGHTTADSAYVWMRQESDDCLEIVAGVGAERSMMLGRRRRRDEGFAGLVWSAGEMRYLADTDSHPATRSDWRSGTELYAVPLHGDDGMRGMLMVTSRPGDQRLEKELPLIEKIAGFASIAIANAQLTSTARSDLRRTHALAELSRMLSGNIDPQDDLDAVCRTLLGAIGATRASAYLADEHGVLQPHSSWAEGASGPERAFVLPSELASETIAQWCHVSGQSARLARTTDDARESTRVHEMRRSLGLGSTCCVPLVRRGLGVGALIVTRSRSEQDFGDGEFAIFGAIVDQLSVALERHELSSELARQALRDGLTLLPNRRSFEAELAESLNDPVRHGEAGAVLFLDLDDFKLVNDTLGHTVGDSLLGRVGRRLAERLPADATLARMGGDEFAVILRNVDRCEGASEAATRLAASFAGPFDIDGSRLSIGASIGVSHYPDDGNSVDELLCNADLAMYRAKADGKGRVVHFDRSFADAARRRAELEIELREALERDELRLLYQPQVDARSGRVTAVEALVRWKHPQRGTVSPGEFIPIAQETGLINPIGAWVLDAAVSRLAGWRGTSLDGVRMCVNVAASQCMLEDFPEQVLDTLSRHGVPATRLELEVTESVVMDGVEEVVQRLKTLRDAGVRIAIDDFGTGYSSLSRLQELPLDVLKIDRAFINLLQEERSEHSLVNTILLLASGLGLETVAEGVETEAQRTAVIALGCDLVQGYLHSPPVTAEALPDVMHAIHRETGADALDRAA